MDDILKRAGIQGTHDAPRIEIVDRGQSPAHHYQMFRNFLETHPIRILAALILTLGLATPLQAQQLLESYVAFLSVDDHYNSRGTRLTAPWQIIRQDRANFHRFGVRDAGDEWDSFFSSQQNRAIAEQMLRNGFIEPGFASYLVNNEALVLVEIFGSGGRGQYIRVTAY